MNNSSSKSQLNVPGNGRGWDWLAATLLLVALQIAAARLVATDWAEDLDTIHVITFFGTLLGFAIGVSMFKRRMSIFLTIAYGALLIPWQFGLTLGRSIEWRERLLSMAGRLNLVFGELSRRDTVSDNMLFLFVMGILFWVLSVASAHALVRRANPWLVILPAGLATFIIHTFDPLLARRAWYLAFYLFFALLLTARMVYLKNQSTWRERHIHTPPDVGFDMTRIAVLVTMLIVLLAWNAPVLADSLEPVAAAWQVATRPWLSAKERLSFAFASLRASVGLVSDAYGKTMILGFGTPLTDEIILEVEAPISPPEDVRYYWRARTYNVYNTNLWESTINESRSFTPENLDLAQPGVDRRVTEAFTFYPHAAISMLYVAPQPIWVSRPSTVTTLYNPDGTVDLDSFEAIEFIRPGEQYQVRSSLSAVTVADLRAAGTEYPEWVLERYLQLPDSITPRTRALAQSLAAGLDTPYDAAQAITTYLRNNIEYSETVDQSPAGQDRVDWFLFDYKKGFCNYYATADVLLLRSLGIPARLAVGYAQGQRQTPAQEAISPGGEPGQLPDESVAEFATFLVRQKDAHAWPEVFFPGIGWIEFEPTSSQEPLFRPSGESFTSDQPEDSAPALDELGQEGLLSQQQTPEPGSQSLSEDQFAATPANILRLVLQYTLLAGSVALLVFVIFQVRRGFRLIPFLEKANVELPNRIEKGLIRLGIQPPGFLVNWAYYVSLPALSKAYQEINRALNRLGNKPSLQDTPAERVKSLTARLPQAAPPAQVLLNEYQAATYSPHEADVTSARKAGSQVRKQSYLALLMGWLRRFQEPEKQKSPWDKR